MFKLFQKRTRNAVEDIPHASIPFHRWPGGTDHTTLTFLVAALLLLMSLAGSLGFTMERYFGFECLPLALLLAGLAGTLLFWERRAVLATPVSGKRWPAIFYLAVASALFILLPVTSLPTLKILALVPGVICALLFPSHVYLAFAAGTVLVLLGGDLLLPGGERNPVFQADLVLCGVLLLIIWIVGSINQKNREVMRTLMRDRNLLRQLFHALPVGIIVLDECKKFTLVNEAAREIFGLEKQALTGRPPDEVPGFPAEQILALCQTTPVHGIELTLTDQRKVVAVETTPLRAPATGWLLLFRDVTESKRIERELARSSRLALIGEIAAGMAHEIRNPLTVIRGFAQLLKGRTGKEVTDYAEFIVEETDRVNRLLEDFLLLARPMRPAFKQLNLAGLLQAVCKLLDSRAREAGVRLQVRMNQPLPPVMGDAEQLRQVFVKVIINAIQATPAGGVVTVTANKSTDQRYLEIAVTDTGVGIPPELADRIFDPFFTTREDGTGLGLAIANRVVHDHRGELRIESQPNRGTVLTVRLPIRTKGVRAAKRIV